MRFVNSSARIARGAPSKQQSELLYIANFIPCKATVLFAKPCIFAYDRVEDLVYYHFTWLGMSKTGRVGEMRYTVLYYFS